MVAASAGFTVTASPAAAGASELAKTAIEFPPMQAPASFNLEAVKAQVEEMIKAHEGQ